MKSKVLLRMSAPSSLAVPKHKSTLLSLWPWKAGQFVKAAHRAFSCGSLLLYYIILFVTICHITVVSALHSTVGHSETPKHIDFLMSSYHQVTDWACTLLCLAYQTTSRGPAALPPRGTQCTARCPPHGVVSISIRNPSRGAARVKCIVQTTFKRLLCACYKKFMISN